MKSTLTKLSVVLLILTAYFLAPLATYAQFLPEPGTPLPSDPNLPTYYQPPKCTSGQGHLDPNQRIGSYCPDIRASDPQAKETNLPYACATTYEEWLKNPNLNFWVEDPEVTALGKGGERSRQFLLWALTRQSIDDHPVILDVWKLSQNVALFMILLVVIVMGIGIIIGQRGIGFMGSSFNTNIEIAPLVTKIAFILLYIIFSARLILVCVQLSDVMMEFFIRTLGVRDLFNIFFIDTAGDVKSVGDALAKSEQAYREFIGCTNWNIGNQEMVTTSKSLVKFTNMTYYFLGGALLLRKIVLWFLLMVSPFLAILAPFVFIRNIGWIWIGVFFQWVFYGPLMALFLGGLANIWNTSPVHIPYIFDFSRVHKMGQMVYPTSINILYGGPAQKLGLFNTSNYVDTFAEYIISLMMLWTVMILPWWLLRIFRDYCCDGIYAMRNVLMAMYDQMRSGPPVAPGPVPTPVPTGTARTALEINQPERRTIEAKIKLETIQEIKQAQTQQIVQSIGIQASNLKEVARMETDRVSREAVTQSLNQIQNPFKAETPSERQKLMNLRNEVQTRAQEGDKLAQRLAAVTARSSTQEHIAKQQLIATMPQVAIPATVAQSTTSQVKVALPESKRQVMVHTALTNMVNNQPFMQKIATDTKVPMGQASHILQSITRLTALDTSTDDAITKTAQEVGVEEVRVKQVISRAASLVRERGDLLENVARQESTDKETVTDAVQEELRGAVGVTSAATDQIVQRVFTQVSMDAGSVSAIAKQAKVPEVTARKILQELAQADQFSLNQEIVSVAAQKSGVEHEQIKKVLESTAVVVDTNAQVVQQVAQAQKVDVAMVTDVAKENIAELSKADKVIEDYVPQTQKVSIEDYEEVKSMWLEHYENGEIPVTENVQSREEWVQQDTVRISNILNKLMSTDKVMQEQGLTEVGYILPIFMVNNLSGEELLVYLKAKIQAAKEVARGLDKEKALREKIKSEDEENLVEVERPAVEEAAKTQVLQEEMEIGGDGDVAKGAGSDGQPEQAVATEAGTMDQAPAESTTPVQPESAGPLPLEPEIIPENGPQTPIGQNSESQETAQSGGFDPLQSIKNKLAQGLKDS